MKVRSISYYCIFQYKLYVLLTLLDINMPKVTVMSMKYLPGEFWIFVVRR